MCCQQPTTWVVVSSRVLYNMLKHDWTTLLFYQTCQQCCYWLGCWANNPVIPCDICTRVPSLCWRPTANKSTLWERLTYVALYKRRRPLNVMINVTIWCYYSLATTFEVFGKSSEFIQSYVRSDLTKPEPKYNVTIMLCASWCSCMVTAG